MRTLRPFGPSVVATALARVSTPARSAALPSTPNLSSCIFHSKLALNPSIAQSSHCEEAESRTLCANLCCCAPKPVLNVDLLRTEARAVEDSARCIV